MSRLGLVLVLCGFVLAQPLAAAASQWPAGGEIVFDVTQGDGGMKLGEGVHRWQHDGRAYTMSTHLKTTGLAAMLADFDYTQSSEGDVTSHGLVPRRFVVEQKGRETESATFDWRTNSVLVERRKGRKETESLARGDLDVLSVWHMVAQRPGRDYSGEMTLVSNSGADPASVKMLGMKELDLPIGRVRVQHVQLKAHSGKLDVELWLSERHAWAPVRVRLKDHKGKVLDQRATRVKLSHPTPQP